MARILSDKVIVLLAVLTVVAIGATMPFALAERGHGCAPAQMEAEIERQLAVINRELAQTEMLQERIHQISDPRLVRQIELRMLASKSEALLARLKLDQQLAAARWFCES